MNNKIRKSYYVYILSSNTGTLYTGVTNHLLRRMDEHKGGKLEGFTKRYKVNRLIYFEETTDIYAALEREKQIKGWTRKKKLDLVRTLNPKFEDLSEDWFEDSLS
ncbi:MAG: GIY-YIG nuclease family protein [Anaerolineales bacterium]